MWRHFCTARRFSILIRGPKNGVHFRTLTESESYSSDTSYSSRTATATRDHPAVAIPARANRAEATAVNPIVRKVNRLARKARASRKVNRIPKIQAAITGRYQVTHGRATRSPVIEWLLEEAQLRGLPHGKFTRTIAKSLVLTALPETNPLREHSLFFRSRKSFCVKHLAIPRPFRSNWHSTVYGKIPGPGKSRTRK
jgi:hypothetical protein